MVFRGPELYPDTQSAFREFLAQIGIKAREGVGRPPQVGGPPPKTIHIQVPATPDLTFSRLKVLEENGSPLSFINETGFSAESPPED